MANSWKYFAVNGDNEYVNGLECMPIDSDRGPKGVHIRAITEDGERAVCGNVARFILRDGLWTLARISGANVNYIHEDDDAPHGGIIEVSP